MITKCYSCSSVSGGAGMLEVVGNSPAINAVKNRIVRVADTDLNVVLLGESGTGKTMMAGIIHSMSNRRGKPFVCKNMAAIPVELAEAELFGTVSGAFTGAVNRPGLVSAANGGTLFFDEIAELSLSAQAKLLHFIETGTYSRVGSTELNRVDVRIICATNANLKELVRQKKFNEALFHRINQVVVEIPPLRERKEDILVISEYFLKKRGFSIKDFSLDAVESLKKYDWPGNVRELEKVLLVTSFMHKDKIHGPEDLVF